jgi:anaerobic magnesium-protoporphyrin IX monomethyl ester cyclase
VRFKKVLLVSPSSTSRYGGLRVPAGIGHIAQALSDKSIDYEYVDMRIGYTFKDIRKKALSFQPDLVGISMITLGYKRAYQMISDLKKLLPHSKIVIGGHHVTILKEKALEDCKDIDFGVVGDGEETIIDLCQNSKSIKDIKGLIFKNGKDIIFNGYRPVVKNLDEYSFPKFEKFNLADYSKQIPIHSSRGCVGQCTFCPNKLIGRGFRKKSASHFVDEIEHWYNKGYRQFAIDDDNFTLIDKRVYDICDEIERRGLKDLFIRCSNGIRADRVDRKLLTRMKEIGVREVGFGVDGGNDKVLGYLKKMESMETIEKAIKTGCDVGMDVKIFIIVGTPNETETDIEDSIKLARRYPVARVNFNNAIPYPGTELYDYVNEHNLFLIPPEEYLNNNAEDLNEERPIPVFETPELSKDDRIRILKRCHKVEKEVMKNTAYRMYRHYPLAGFFIKYFFNVAMFERLFFKNLTLRKFFEWIRYRKILRR